MSSPAQPKGVSFDLEQDVKINKPFKDAAPVIVCFDPTGHKGLMMHDWSNWQNMGEAGWPKNKGAYWKVTVLKRICCFVKKMNLTLTINNVEVKPGSIKWTFGAVADSGPKMKMEMTREIKDNADGTSQLIEEVHVKEAGALFAKFGPKLVKKTMEKRVAAMVQDCENGQMHGNDRYAEALKKDPEFQ